MMMQSGQNWRGDDVSGSFHRPWYRRVFDQAKVRAGVCTGNSDSNVLMMQPADQGMRYDVSDPLNRARDRCSLVQ